MFCRSMINTPRHSDNCWIRSPQPSHCRLFQLNSGYTAVARWPVNSASTWSALVFAITSRRLRARSYGSRICNSPNSEISMNTGSSWMISIGFSARLNQAPRSWMGVGHGDFVRATMVNQAYRSRQRGWSPDRPVQVIGLEYSQDSLTQARQSLRALHRELDSDFAGTLT